MSAHTETAAKGFRVRERATTGGEATLFTSSGERKYQNSSERARILAVIGELEPHALTFMLTLFWTGARVSEVLALTPEAIDVDESSVTFRTLKRRSPHLRQVPVPPFLASTLDRHFNLRHVQLAGSGLQRPLWDYCRQTAWRVVKRIMKKAGICGVRATPRGFRHAFAVAALHAHVPLNLVQRWMGHARLETTAIYAQVSGPDERVFAARMWQDQIGA